MTLYSDSKIIRTETKFIVPEWILDDVGYFYPEVYTQIIPGSETRFPIEYISTFIQLRKQIYWLCNWYDELTEDDIPVIHSDLYCIQNDPQIMQLILESKLAGENKFIRFCNASPKDILDPIFKTADTVVDVFQQSARTNYMFDGDHQTHLVIRPYIKIDHEVRCVWHKHQLRAVSGPSYYIGESIQTHIKNLIGIFFQKYGPDIIFNSAIIDIGICLDGVYVIEINSFGSDMLARIAYFDWEGDFMILYNSDECVYRFKPEFEW